MLTETIRETLTEDGLADEALDRSEARACLCPCQLSMKSLPR